MARIRVGICPQTKLFEKHCYYHIITLSHDLLTAHEAAHSPISTNQSLSILECLSQSSHFHVPVSPIFAINLQDFLWKHLLLISDFLFMHLGFFWFLIIRYFSERQRSQFFWPGWYSWHFFKTDHFMFGSTISSFSFILIFLFQMKLERLVSFFL